MTPAVPVEQKRGSFLPIFRLSPRALRLLDQKYRAGVTGFSEMVVPTLLHLEGYKLQDIGGNNAYVAPDDRDRFYTWRTFHLNRMATPGDLPDTLYHPVR
jgi:hypothetical protein